MTQARESSSPLRRAAWPRVLGAALSAVGLFVLQAFEGDVPRAPLLGLVLAVAAGGFLASLVRAPETVAPGLPAWLAPLEGEAGWRAPLVTVPAALAVLLLGALALGYPALPWVVALALLALVPSALRRPGVFAFVVVGLLYLPKLGTYGLWDPWETHYGEVAREILARKDWISLWWAQENWFWSKPILIFWSEAFSLGALGVSPLPDANPANPEWALRLPLVLGALLGLFSTYALLRRAVGARAAVLAVLVVATLPHFFFLAHQAITDMYFVANMMVAVAFLGGAITEPGGTDARGYRLGPLVVSLQHVVLVLFVAAVLPQATYLISRNLSWNTSGTISFHPDRFLYGSAGNKGVPGNDPHRTDDPFLEAWALQPIAQGLLWIALLALLVFWLWRERRVHALWMQCFYFFCALAFMGKGIPGIALPGLVALLYLVVSGRWQLLVGGHLTIARGVLSTAIVALPWFVAMYMRHGPRFTDRLLIHDHINRLASGVHGDTGSIEYFLEQMGYGMFPWIGLLPAAAGVWFAVARDARSTDAEKHVALLYTLWFFGAFTLFNAMVTKFHHYIFPAEPAAGVLIAILIERALRSAEEGGAAEQAESLWMRVRGAFAAALGGVLVALGVGALRGNLRGVLPESAKGADAAEWVFQHKEPALYSYGFVALGAALLAAAWWWNRARGAEERAALARGDAGLKVAFLSGAMLLAFVARDFAWKPSERPVGYEKLLQLFVYNYKRPWPEHLDYRPILWGFGVVLTALLALSAARSLRRVAVPAFFGVALAFSGWVLGTYMIDLSPHWGQRELIKKYYELRKGPEEPLLAYQMNWKGENFYTGNHAFVFVKLDTKLLKEWVKKNAGKHCFAILEHGRVSGFKGHVRGGEVKEVTTKRDNNKFVLLDVKLPLSVETTPEAAPKASDDDDDPSARP